MPVPGANRGLKTRRAFLFPGNTVPPTVFTAGLRKTLPEGKKFGKQFTASAAVFAEIFMIQ
jgi:hypothetical protein